MAKQKTNEQLLRALLKDISGIEAVILRERLLKIAEMTKQNIKDEPEAYTKGFIHVSVFESVCDKINEHLKVE